MDRKKITKFEAAASSPQFVKPFDVFLRQKRKAKNSIAISPLKCLGNAHPNSQFSPLKVLDTNSPAKASVPAKSPYKLKKTPVKKGDSENYVAVPRRRLALKSSPLKKPSPGRTPKRQLHFGGIFHESVPLIVLDDDTNLEAPVKKPKPDDKPDCVGVPRLPIDWSLKTRIRFISNEKFPCSGSQLPWQGTFKASEDATGTTSFVRCLHSTSAEDSPVASGTPLTSAVLNQNTNSNTSSPSSQKRNPVDTSLPAVLRQHSFVWSHPHLPWMTLFPRINTGPSQSVSKGQSFQIEAQSNIAESLFDDWSISMRSLYNLIKTRQCPFFYVCAASFTCLFRSSGIAGMDDINVMITPTTSGLRGHLKQEGIDYIMPFREQSDDKSFEEATSTGEQSDEPSVSTEPIVKAPEGVEHDDEPSIFLESLGLSQQDFPSLSNKRAKLGKLNCSKAKRETLCFISGSDTLLLLNFLINSKISLATTGSMAYVPPTLLSPVAFHGATLQQLKLKQTSSTYKGETLYNLDITGPVLPSAVKALSEFFRETQAGNFKSNLITHEPTALFASSTAKITGKSSMFSAFATESLKDCGLTSELVNEFCSKEHQSSETLREVALEDNVYKLKISPSE